MRKQPFVAKRIVNVGVAALARECGLSKAAISKRLSTGESPDQIRARAAWRQGRPLSKRKGIGRPPLASEYEMVVQGRERLNALDEMKFRRAKALAERQEIENALRRGELVPVAYIRRWGGRFLIAARDELLRIPSELADTLALETDAVKVATILRAAQEKAIAKLEQMEHLWRGNLDEQQVAC